MSTFSDERCVGAAGEGPPGVASGGSANEPFSRLWGSLVSLARRSLRNASDAEDVAGEAVQRAIVALGALASLPRISAVAMQSVASVVVDRWRVHARAKTSDVDVGSLDDLGRGRAAAESHDLLAWLSAQLSESEQRALSCWLAGASLTEVAGLLGVSDRAVRSYRERICALVLSASGSSPASFQSRRLERLPRERRQADEVLRRGSRDPRSPIPDPLSPGDSWQWAAQPRIA